MEEKYLDEAILEASYGVKMGHGGPFGAIIVDTDGKVISRGHNQVLVLNDPTAHAEIMAIREACKKMGTYDLSGCTIYSSCEPCPMCLSAIIWSNIGTVFFGANRFDASKIGFRDEPIYEFFNGKNQILVTKDCNHSNCKRVLDEYKGEIY